MHRSLILGYGEIGQSIYSVFSKHYRMDWVDLGKTSIEYNEDRKYKVLHVCIPWQEDFVRTVDMCALKHKVDLVIVHSTVPVGTTEQLKYIRKVHAPIRGRHENLAEGIKAYTMFIGFMNEDELQYALEYLNNAKIPVAVYKRYKTTEAAKLLELLQYGMNIEFARYAQDVCNKFGISYPAVVMDYAMTHNNTVKLIDDANLQKPILHPPKGEIGGHCVLPGIRLLCKQVESPILKDILAINASLQTQQNMASM